MIQMQTVLNVADNSGAKKVACVKVLGGSKRRYAGVGDVIVVSVKEAIPNSKVKKGDVLGIVLTRTAADAKSISEKLQNAYKISAEIPKTRKHVRARV